MPACAPGFDHDFMGRGYPSRCVHCGIHPAYVERPNVSLPRPSVSVNSRPSEDGNGHRIDVIIGRQRSTRSYGVTAPTEVQGIGEIIGKILADPYTIEWLPERKP